MGNGLATGIVTEVLGLEVLCVIIFTVNPSDTSWVLDNAIENIKFILFLTNISFLEINAK